jgi:hypothetical protein
MAEKRPRLTTQPGFLALGTHFAGATLRGSLQVLGGTSGGRWRSVF